MDYERIERGEMDNIEYEVLDFSEAVRMLKFVFDKDKKENTCALQFTIRVYFENLQRDLAENPKSRSALRLVKK